MLKQDFGWAVNAVKKGKKATRAEWNDKDTFIFLVPGSTFSVNTSPLSNVYPQGTKIDYTPHIDMKTRNGPVTPWSPKHVDLLAEDWELVP